MIKHTNGGRIIISSINSNDKKGIQIESVDSGPGIKNAKKFIGDGFSTTNTLGTGLGAINRLADELVIHPTIDDKGTHFIVKKWIYKKNGGIKSICPLDIGAFTRPLPSENINGDDIVIKYWNSKGRSQRNSDYFNFYLRNSIRSLWTVVSSNMSVPCEEPS